MPSSYSCIIVFLFFNLNCLQLLCYSVIWQHEKPYLIHISVPYFLSRIKSKYLYLKVLLKNAFSDMPTQEKSRELGGLNYIQIICITQIEWENQPRNLPLNLPSVNTDITFCKIWPDSIYEGPVNIKASVFKTYAYSLSLPMNISHYLRKLNFLFHIEVTVNRAWDTEANRT